METDFFYSLTIRHPTNRSIYKEGVAYRKGGQQRSCSYREQTDLWDTFRHEPYITEEMTQL